MLSAGSQADSAEKQLKLPVVPYFFDRARSPLQQRRRTSARCCFARRCRAAKLVVADGQTEKTRTGMNATFAPATMTAYKSARHRLFRACACCGQQALPPQPARRNFLAGGLAALGLGASGLGASGLGASGALTQPAWAQTAAPAARIDVHHHYVPKVH